MLTRTASAIQARVGARLRGERVRSAPRYRPRVVRSGWSPVRYVCSICEQERRTVRLSRDRVCEHCRWEIREVFASETVRRVLCG